MRAVTLNATFQLLIIYRLWETNGINIVNERSKVEDQNYDYYTWF